MFIVFCKFFHIKFTPDSRTVFFSIWFWIVLSSALTHSIRLFVLTMILWSAIATPILYYIISYLTSYLFTDHNDLLSVIIEIIFFYFLVILNFVLYVLSKKLWRNTLNKQKYWYLANKKNTIAWNPSKLENYYIK